MTEEMQVKKVALLVGRHSANQTMGYDELIGENVLFSLEPTEVDNQLTQLLEKAVELNADLIFQNAPAVLVGALMRRKDDYKGVKVGIVVSKPGPRIAGEEEHYFFTSLLDAQLAAKAIQFANARAKVEVSTIQPVLKIAVDPVPFFEFIRIEYLN